LKDQVSAWFLRVRTLPYLARTFPVPREGISGLTAARAAATHPHALARRVRWKKRTLRVEQDLASRLVRMLTGCRYSGIQYFPVITAGIQDYNRNRHLPFDAISEVPPSAFCISIRSEATE